MGTGARCVWKGPTRLKIVTGKGNNLIGVGKVTKVTVLSILLTLNGSKPNGSIVKQANLKEIKNVYLKSRTTHKRSVLRTYGVRFTE